MSGDAHRYWTISYKRSVSVGALVGVGVEVGELHVKNVSTGEVGVFVFIAGEGGPSATPLTLARFADSPTLIETPRPITLEDFAGHTELFSAQGGAGLGWSFSVIQFRDVAVSRQWGVSTAPGRATQIDRRKFAEDNRPSHAIDVSGPMLSTPTASGTACLGYSKLVGTYREQTDPQLIAEATSAAGITTEDINEVGREVLGDAWIDLATRPDSELEALLVEEGLGEALDALHRPDVTGADQVVRQLETRPGPDQASRDPTPRRIPAGSVGDSDPDVLSDDGFDPDPSHDLSFIPDPAKSTVVPPPVDHLTGLPDDTAALIDPDPASTHSGAPDVGHLSGLPAETTELVEQATGHSSAPDPHAGRDAPPSHATGPDPGSVGIHPTEAGGLSGLPEATVDALDPDPASSLVEPDVSHLSGLPDATTQLIQPEPRDDTTAGTNADDLSGLPDATIDIIDPDPDPGPGPR